VTVHDAGSPGGYGRTALGQGLSAKVDSRTGIGIIVERPMYFSYAGGIDGTHNVLGTTKPRSSWYFAEGWTGTGFDEYLTIMNPNGALAQMRVTYFFPNGSTSIRNFNVNANSRFTIAVHDNGLGVGRGQATSIKVDNLNGVPVVAERPIYFSYGGAGYVANDGSSVVGAPAPSTVWYFAEGSTPTNFDMYLSIFNPTGTSAPIDVTYYLDSGPTVRSLTAAANTRTTIPVFDASSPGGLGRGHARVSAKVQVANSSGTGIVVERPLYFSYNGINGGHTVMGALAPRHKWYFAEGYTANGFDLFLVIFNPDAAATTVQITYFKAGPGGGTPTRTVTVQPRRRTEIAVHDDPLVGRNNGQGWPVSMLVETVQSGNGSAPVVVERAMYVNSAGRTGGHDIVGYVP
jgi:hypothetical protein